MTNSSSFIELIYIDSDDDVATWAEFQRYRRYGVDIKQARFLLDYHNRKGDLGSTVAINAEGFRAITGQEPKTDQEYRQIDADFWDEVSAARPASRDVHAASFNGEERGSHG